MTYFLKEKNKQVKNSTNISVLKMTKDNKISFFYIIKLWSIQETVQILTFYNFHI